MTTNRLIGELPKVGIRPVIDGRLQGVRESLEIQTMNMAKAAAQLISENLRFPSGDKIECVIADSTIGGVAEAALCAEKLKINFPFVRGEKNDMRMAHDFLERIASSGKKNYKIEKNPKIEHKPFSEAIEAFESADKLIVSWGNRSSHSFDLVKPEAEKLIDACEKALGFFTCPSCNKNVWFATTNDGFQCQCSALRWKL